MNALSKNTEIYGNDNYLSLKCLFKFVELSNFYQIFKDLYDFNPLTKQTVDVVLLLFNQIKTKCNYKRFQPSQQQAKMGSVSSEIKNSQVQKQQYDKFVLSYGLTQGLRNTMEDTLLLLPQFAQKQSLFAVFDGHGGSGISQLLRDQFQRYFRKQLYIHQNRIHHALINTLKSIDQFILSENGNQFLSKKMQQIGNFYSTGQDHIAARMGSTANIVFIATDKIYTANVGDSKAVLCRKGKGIALSVDHKPHLPNEKQRIQKSGFRVDCGRINGGLNLSRSIGDSEYKQMASLSYDQQAVICKPEIKQIQRSKQDEFLLIGTDGIWQRYQDQSCQKLIDYISKNLKQGIKVEKIIEKMFKMLKAKSRSQPVGCDNMAAILIVFK